jgi:hypothetical protein
MDHANWSEERGRAKFERFINFGARLPDIRDRVDIDLRARGLPMDKALATIVWILDNLYIRVANDSYAETNGSYGLTTLRNRHVKIEGSSLRFRFKGKSGKDGISSIAIGVSPTSCASSRKYPAKSFSNMSVMRAAVGRFRFHRMIWLDTPLLPVAERSGRRGSVFNDPGRHGGGRHGWHLPARDLAA